MYGRYSRAAVPNRLLWKRKMHEIGLQLVQLPLKTKLLVKAKFFVVADYFLEFRICWLPTSGIIPQPATFGLGLFCGMSGTIAQAAGVTSGVLAQRIGRVMRSGWAFISIDNEVTSGLNATFYGNF